MLTISRATWTKLVSVALLLPLIWPLPALIGHTSADGSVFGRYDMDYFALLAGYITVVFGWSGVTGWAVWRLSADRLDIIRSWLQRHLPVLSQVFAAILIGLLGLQFMVLSRSARLPDALFDVWRVLPALLAGLFALLGGMLQPQSTNEQPQSTAAASKIDPFRFPTAIKSLGWRKWLAPLGLLLALVLLSAYFESLYPYRYSSDQANHAVMVLNELKPENLANDYIWQDPVYSSLYIPGYQYLLTVLTRLFGSFGTALNFLMIPVGLTFGVGMFLLIYQLTTNEWLSTGIMLLAMMLRLRSPLGGRWYSMLAFESMVPRSLYLALVPFLFGGLFRLLSVRPRRWIPWALLGFAFGITTNIHPVSGYVAAGVLGGIVVLAAIRQDIRWQSVFWVAVGGLVGLLPILVDFVSGMQAVPVANYDVTFKEFLAVARSTDHDRIWPWTWYVRIPILTESLLPAEELSVVQQLVLFASHGVLTVLAGIGLWLTQDKPHSRWRWISLLVLIATQTLVIALFVSDNSVLSLYMSLYALTIFIHNRKADWLDLRLYEMLALLFFLTSISAVIQLIWVRFEVWGLTPWGRMLPRGLRFIYLPAYLFMARLLVWWQREFGWGAALAGLVLLLFPVSVTRPADGFSFLLFGVLVIAWLVWPHRDNRPRLAHYIAVGASAAFVTAQVEMALSIQGSHLPALVTLLLVTTLAWLRDRQPDLRRAIRVGLVGGTLGVMLLVPQRYEAGGKWRPLMMVLPRAAPRLADTVPLFEAEPPTPQEYAFWEMAEWVKDTTPIDSVFYLDDDAGSFDNNVFRYHAERSVTHAGKDQSIAYMLQYPYVAVVNRDRDLQAGFESPGALSERAYEYGADYVVLYGEQRAELSPSWPIVYQNDYYTVYQLP